MYKPTDKMRLLLANEEEAIQIISRFGLSMGVGEQTIEEACTLHNVHTPTFLAVVNHKVFRQPVQPKEIDAQTLNCYLRNAHTYFLEFRLPRLRQALIEAINPADPDSRIPLLILRCYDEFVAEIRTHIDHENNGRYEEHEHDDQRITDKLTEIKNLIIRYFPNNNTVSYPLISVMSDLWHTEQDFADHCAIEDECIIKAKKRKAKGEGLVETTAEEELSDREQEVLIELARGRSNKEVADVLCISPHTVITHRKNITRKLNIHSVAGLTIYAIVRKLITV